MGKSNGNKIAIILFVNITINVRENHLLFWQCFIFAYLHIKSVTTCIIDLQ